MPHIDRSTSAIQEIREIVAEIFDHASSEGLLEITFNALQEPVETVRLHTGDSLTRVAGAIHFAAGTERWSRAAAPFSISCEGRLNGRDERAIASALETIEGFNLQFWKDVIGSPSQDQADAPLSTFSSQGTRLLHALETEDVNLLLALAPRFLGPGAAARETMSSEERLHAALALVEKLNTALGQSNRPLATCCLDFVRNSPLFLGDRGGSKDLAAGINAHYSIRAFRSFSGQCAAIAHAAENTLDGHIWRRLQTGVDELTSYLKSFSASE
jgi:hypothetical protein